MSEAKQRNSRIENGSRMSEQAAKEREFHFQVWAKAVDTQMHFNEMSVKSRQLGLAFVAGALGVAIVLLSRSSDDFYIRVPISKSELRFHVGFLIMIGATLAINAVRQLDLGVYHKMLRGAVTFGEDFEQTYLKRYVKLEKGMTQAISHFSRMENASADQSGERIKYLGDRRITAYDKIRGFYRKTTWFMVIAGLFILFVTNWRLIVFLWDSRP